MENIQVDLRPVNQQAQQKWGKKLSLWISGSDLKGLVDCKTKPHLFLILQEICEICKDTDRM
jgi:hypothetical protein